MIDGGVTRVYMLNKYGYLNRLPFKALKAASQDYLIRIPGPCAPVPRPPKAAPKASSFGRPDT